MIFFRLSTFAKKYCSVSYLWKGRQEQCRRVAKEKPTSDLACCAVSPFAPDTTDMLARSDGGAWEMHAFWEVDVKLAKNRGSLRLASRFLGFWKFKFRPQLIRYVEKGANAEARDEVCSVAWGAFSWRENAATTCMKRDWSLLGKSCPFVISLVLLSILSFL